MMAFTVRNEEDTQDKKKEDPDLQKRSKKLPDGEQFGISSVYLQQSKKCSSDVKPL